MMLLPFLFLAYGLLQFPCLIIKKTEWKRMECMRNFHAIHCEFFFVVVFTVSRVVNFIKVFKLIFSSLSLKKFRHFFHFPLRAFSHIIIVRRLVILLSKLKDRKKFSFNAPGNLIQFSILSLFSHLQLFFFIHKKTNIERD